MSFDKIYGHRKIIDRFKEKLKNDRLSHSYIFEGLDGIGKKTFAVALAKAIFCENSDIDGCDQCTSCRKISHSNHPDLKIIVPDGKSIKNAQIKSFQKFLSYKPNESDHKVVIIEKSETMTRSAQNTILKVLEEPPSYGKIIFICNNTNRLLDTIKSRGQTIKFNTLSDQEMEKFLLDSFDVSSEKLKFIQVLSNGVVSRALKIAESDDFFDIREKVIKFANQLLLNKTIKALKFIEDIQKNKDSIHLYFDIMIQWYRDLLIFQKTHQLQRVKNKDKEKLIKEISFKTIDKNIVKIIEEINQSLDLLDRNVNFKLVIDAFVLNIIG